MFKIYLLEDDRIISELIKFDLSNEFNCEVISFKNGNDLMDNINSSPDLIILDHFLENDFDENGFIVLKRIKAAYPCIPVIIFSGQQDIELAMEFLKIGAEGYVDKNGESYLKDLNTCINRVLSGAETIDRKSKFEKNIEHFKMNIFGFGSFPFF